MKKILPGLLFSLLLKAATTAFSQVVVTFPTDRAVFQRSNANQADVYIGGYLTSNYQQVEARFVPLVAGEGEAAPAGGGWQVLDTQFEAGQYYGSMPVKGGWYRLEVRGTSPGKESQIASVAHVGVGEVFVVAGQSNATGGDANPNGPGAAHDQVNSVNFQNVNNGTITPYLSVQLPCPEFVHLDANVKTAPFGNYAWCWGSFGDKLYEKLRVPVMIFNAGWSSTGVDNWKETIDPNGVTNSAFGYTFPAGLPFGHLRLALNYYIAQLGVRAVLWHQGETDNYLEQPGDNTYNRYISSLWQVISASRSLTGKNNLAWVVARASRFTVNGASRVSANVVNAQNEVINNNAAYPHVYQGPDTDPYYTIEYRGDEIHFRGDGVTPSPDGNVYSGLISLAGFWNDHITPDFISQSQPYAATPPPAVSATAASGAAQVTFTGPAIPAGAQYNWLNAGDCNQVLSTSQQFVASTGQFRLKIVDALRNTTFSPLLNASTAALPVVWKSFTAEKSDNKVLLKWATTSETAALHFEVERSVNAVNFVNLQNIAAAGTSANLHQYQYTDEYLAPGSYYYRLKQVDFDGTFSFTRILPLTIEATLAAKAYPNPAREQLTVSAAKPLGTVEVRTLAGKQIFSSEKAGTSLTIPLGKQAPGLYIINTDAGTFRVIKQD